MSSRLDGGLPLRVLAILLLGLAVPFSLPAQGVRGGADSVKVRLAGIERQPMADSGDSRSRISVQVAIEHAAGFHSWPNEPVVPPELRGLNAIATEIELVSAPDDVELERIEWPEPVTVTVRYAAEPLDLLSFDGKTIARVLLRRRAGDSSGRAELAVRFQSCDEQYCYPPRREILSVPLALDP